MERSSGTFKAFEAKERGMLGMERKMLKAEQLGTELDSTAVFLSIFFVSLLIRPWPNLSIEIGQ